jgi:hypothetical protein
MDVLERYAYAAVDRGLVPDAALRRAVRYLTRQRLSAIEHGSVTANHEAKMAFVELLRSRDIAIEQDKANEQHYEVPPSASSRC